MCGCIRCCCWRSCSRGLSATLAWGALLHDIGKPATYQPPNPEVPGDRIRFNGHVEVGVRMSEVILERLRFSREDSDQIVALVKNHMRFGDVLNMRESTLKRFFRLNRFEEHLELHRMDCLLLAWQFATVRVREAALCEAPPETDSAAAAGDGAGSDRCGLQTGDAVQGDAGGRRGCAAGEPGDAAAGGDEDAARALWWAAAGFLDVDDLGVDLGRAVTLAQTAERFDSNDDQRAYEQQHRRHLSRDTRTQIRAVIGAGMAGLTAARALAEAGQRVLVLEAQNRVGGRILTERVGDAVIELGAEFVHGRPPELLALIEEAGLTLAERDGAMVRYEDGRLPADERRRSARTLFAPLEELKDFSGPDVSFAEFLGASRPVSEKARTALIALRRGLQRRGSSADQRGRARGAAGGRGGDRELPGVSCRGRIRSGAAVSGAADRGDGGALRADTRVERVVWQRGHVEAQTNQGSFTAKRAIVTLPLGVLQRGRSCSIPSRARCWRRRGGCAWERPAASRCVFRESFWKTLPPQPEMAQLSFLFTQAWFPRCGGPRTRCRAIR